MNSFEKYKELRSKYGMSASAAHHYVKADAALRWRQELRGWKFDGGIAMNNMSDKDKIVYAKALGDGTTVLVRGGYDQDYDALDGYCTFTSRYREGRWEGQMCLSHEEGRYFVWSYNEWVVVEFTDGMDTDYYRKQGYSKQAAFERAVAGRKKQLEYIEKVLREGSSGYFIYMQLVRGYDEDDDNNERNLVVLAESETGGCEIWDDDDLVDVLEDHWCEVLAQLTNAA